MKIKENATIEDFLKTMGRTYCSNNHVYKVEVAFDDGSGPLKLVFETEQGFKDYQTRRKGDIKYL